MATLCMVVVTQPIITSMMRNCMCACCVEHARSAWSLYAPHSWRPIAVTQSCFPVLACPHGQLEWQMPGQALSGEPQHTQRAQHRASQRHPAGRSPNVAGNTRGTMDLTCFSSACLCAAHCSSRRARAWLRCAVPKPRGSATRFASAFCFSNMCCLMPLDGRSLRPWLGRPAAMGRRSWDFVEAFLHRHAVKHEELSSRLRWWAGRMHPKPP